MGRIRHRSSGAEHELLQSRVIIGRDPSCTLPIADPKVSGLHAELRWTPRGWQLRDLSSTNGTWFGKSGSSGLEMRVDAPVTVRVGDVVNFGGLGSTFDVVCDRRPPASARPQDAPEHAIIEDHRRRGLAIPGRDQALPVRPTREQWQVGDATLDGTPFEPLLLDHEGRTWELVLPTLGPETERIEPPDALPRSRAPELRMFRSPGGKVAVTVVEGNEAVDCGAIRGFDLLWHLGQRPADWWTHAELEERMCVSGPGRLAVLATRARSRLTERLGWGEADAGLLIEGAKGLYRLRLPADKVVLVDEVAGR